MENGQCIIGCCGWAQAQARYVTNFPAIEIQATFYEPPATRVAMRWKSQSPPGFRFCIKAWQLITHTPASPTYRRLRSAISQEETNLYGSFRPTEQVALAWERTREMATILDAPVIVFQCPKSFLPTPENVRNLSGFFQRIDRGDRTFAWEPRGEDWPPDLIRDICTANHLIHCVDPFVGNSVYGSISYWRLHGKGSYRYQYTDEDLTEIEIKLRKQADFPGPHYVMFNNMTSAQDALRLLQRRASRAGQKHGATLISHNGE